MIWEFASRESAWESSEKKGQEEMLDKSTETILAFKLDVQKVMDHKLLWFNILN